MRASEARETANVPVGAAAWLEVGRERARRRAPRWVLRPGFRSSSWGAPLNGLRATPSNFGLSIEHWEALAIGASPLRIST
jgi:hypothetical protein